LHCSKVDEVFPPLICEKVSCYNHYLKNMQANGVLSPRTPLVTFIPWGPLGGLLVSPFGHFHGPQPRWGGLVTLPESANRGTIPPLGGGGWLRLPSCLPPTQGILVFCLFLLN